jgi:hypothetical protein
MPTAVCAPISALDTEPSHVALATSENVTFAWDTTNYVVSSGDTSISSPSSELTDISVIPNAAVALGPPPVVNGLQVWQELIGANLLPKHQYVIYITFTGDQSSNTMTMRTFIDVPF